MSHTKTGRTPSLRRVLKTRHMSMIAIGGAIGTGLFVASGATIAQAGPGGALLAYIVIGAMVYFMMTSLGEMSANFPVSGSFATYGSLYVEEGFGFALGWNYWYSWAIVVAVDLVAAQLVMAYWFPEINGILWSAGFLAVMVALNSFSVKGFGEAEYWFAAIKVGTVIVFISVGLLMIFGIIRGGQPDGVWGSLALWTQGDAPFAGGFSALVGVAMIAGFSFQGTELIGIAAGESENPRESVPRATRQVFWRILLFYIFAIFIISLLIPYTDPRLLSGEDDISVSPFALVFERAGLLSAAAVMNAVVLSSVLSAGNSGMYASSRMLYTLACQRMAPRMFAYVNARGVPLMALAGTTAMAALCFLSWLHSPETVYLWLLNASGVTGFITWLCIAVCHYRFRRAYVAQGHDLNDLPYRASGFPYGPFFAFAVCMIVTLGQNYQAFLAERIDWGGVVSTYIGLPLFFLIWGGYRLIRRSRMVSLQEMRVTRVTRGGQ